MLMITARFFFRLYFSMHFCVDRALLYLFEILRQNVSDVRSNLKLEVSITQWNTVCRQES